MTIHTMSTKCQYSPATSTFVASAGPSRPRTSSQSSASRFAQGSVTLSVLPAAQLPTPSLAHRRYE